MWWSKKVVKNKYKVKSTTQILKKYKFTLL